MPALGEFAVRSLDVAGGQVVEHQGVFLEVALGEALLDGRLPLDEPVHRGVPTRAPVVSSALHRITHENRPSRSGQEYEAQPRERASAGFRAIINSIHAIEESTPTNGKITVTIERSPAQRVLQADGPVTIEPIDSFLVADNGAGFTDRNFASFDTADSRAKAGQGGKGMGAALFRRRSRKTHGALRAA